MAMHAPLVAALSVMGLAAMAGSPPAAAPPAVPTQTAPAGNVPPAAAPVAPAAPDDDPLPTQIPNLSDASLPVVRLMLGGENFDLELAATDAAITKGLSGRERVRRHRGMLFVMPYSRELGFWMVDCLVPIDIAYVDEQGVVTGVHTMKVEPPQRADESRGAYEVRLPRYPSGAKSRYAIELAEGEFKRLGIAKGSRIAVDWPAVNTLAKATRVAGSRR
jgi:uncharacterized membrane protein (UPF0127 family)